MPSTRTVALLLLTCLLSWTLSTVHAESDADSVRTDARQLYRDGNYRDALEKFRQLTLEQEATEPAAMARDVTLTIACYQRLNQADQLDDYLESLVEQHDDHWQVLAAIAGGYRSIPHYGVLIANEFIRGTHRGGTPTVQVWARDRVSALRLYRDAVRLVEEDRDAQGSARAAALLNEFAATLQQTEGGGAWQLQQLTDLQTIPDYQEGGYSHWRGGAAPGAPVDDSGDPIFYDLPASWEEAASDGERWRWVLNLRSQWQPKLQANEWLDRAHFLKMQFGVQTLSEYDWFRPRSLESGDTSGVYAVHTLEDGETIAKLAVGVRRFSLPAEHNHVLLCQRIMQEAGPGDSIWEQAAAMLAEVYKNRRQYPRAADIYRQLIEAGRVGYRDALDQIIGNWGALEPVTTQPAGRGATIEYRYRNGEQAEFVAREIDVERLLADLKSHLKSRPKELDWRRIQLEQLGYRLVHERQEEYLGKEVARWTVQLDPRPNHFDRRTTVTTPLDRPGAYLLTAKMKEGNTESVVIWVTDAGIVKKPLDGRTLYYVADAASGKPLAGANVEFFGYQVEHRQGGKVSLTTSNFAKRTNQNGFVELPEDEQHRQHQWLAIARPGKGSLALLGFHHVWGQSYRTSDYKQVKALAITDRPVYRPGQKVQFKFWVRHVSYGETETQRFANQTFQVEIRNPRNEQVYHKSLVADAEGGLADSWTAPEGAMLGQYQIRVVNHGGGTFRIEEYKKPEFEVSIGKPDKPVALGDDFTATIEANYYFGAPVTKAEVHYKVLRTPRTVAWYPPSPWDWLYGEGYWWFTPDYAWYPGFARWGCPGPKPYWFWQAPTPPEVIAERQVEIGPDGKLEIKIDTDLAKQFHSDTDHSYQIQAEVTDESRRTIVATSEVVVTRQPFEVYLWTDRGYYHAGQTMEVGVQARTAAGEPVTGTGVLRLLAISYQQGEPTEREVARWQLATNRQGRAQLQITAAESGQYRLAYVLADQQDRRVESAQILTVRGENFTGEAFHFDEVEVVPDRREYQPGDTAKLQVSVDKADAAVLLFIRPVDGVYLPPRLLQIEGKSTVVDLEILADDMPNFFVEAVTVHDGQMHQTVREIFVPPTERVVQVEVVPSADAYLPGEKATAQIRLTDLDGKPVVGSTVVAIYDKALEYISGGGNVPNIKEFFWKWRRHHQPRSETNLGRVESPVAKPQAPRMQSLGVFGNIVADQDGLRFAAEGGQKFNRRLSGVDQAKGMADAAMPQAETAMAPGDSAAEEPLVEATVRKEFADTALWVAALETNSDGLAKVDLTMPENLTAWNIKVWAMAPGTRVGQAASEVVTRKNLLVRLQAPRFFVETDEVVLSANVHNYLADAKAVRVRLELEGGTLEAPETTTQMIQLEAGGEQRVDWRVRAVGEGTATIRMIAQSDVESDAMEQSFPVLVHGMLKTEAVSGVLRPEQNTGQFTVTVPGARRVEQTRLEIRYSPTLAGAMLDALPYLADYPYGCTEQTLNRFLPAVITARTLERSGFDLESIQAAQANLNAQEIGDPRERAAQWERPKFNPVFNQEELDRRVEAGVRRLTEMQLSDGGWGWFSGWGERSMPHTTATVVRGLLVAQQNEAPLVPGVLERGVEWLKRYQQQELQKLENYDRETNQPRNKDLPAKSRADNLDAFCYQVLVAAGETNPPMSEYLYTDRLKLSVYALALYGLALEMEEAGEKLDMVFQNLSQYVQEDDENQTAWLELPGSYWAYWYGSEYEAQATYLKLLVRRDPQGRTASRLVKYLLNNRKHATYWNSTRDTALVVEAMADYLVATGEAQPNLQLEVIVDGETVKEIEITRENLFTFDDRVVLVGEELAAGEHTVELRKQGEGPLYYNAYLTNFTKEDPIDAAGLEIKIERRYYRLTPRESQQVVRTDRGQIRRQQSGAYERRELVSGEQIASGELIEVELIVESKNDYEYILLADPKAAGCEAVGVQSGYTGNALNAYVEYRDQEVTLFVARLARGRHSVSYRLRAEIPGQFSALPAVAAGMYAPELRGNSTEFKLEIGAE